MVLFVGILGKILGIKKIRTKLKYIYILNYLHGNNNLRGGRAKRNIIMYIEKYNAKAVQVLEMNH